MKYPLISIEIITVYLIQLKEISHLPQKKKISNTESQGTQLHIIK